MKKIYLKTKLKFKIYYPSKDFRSCRVYRIEKNWELFKPSFLVIIKTEKRYFKTDKIEKNWELFKPSFLVIIKTEKRYFKTDKIENVL
jgi:hypothetical protein